MKVLHTLGADLSKQSIDLAACPLKVHLKVPNSSEGFLSIKRWIHQLGIDPSKLLIVMEHTGLYSYHLEAFLHKHGLAFVKVSALAIKRSMGLVRGKSDKVDAQRIARFGFEKSDTLTPCKKEDQTLERLQVLRATRERLVKQAASLKCAVKEYATFLKATDPVIQCQKTMIRHFQNQIRRLDAQITSLLKATPPLQHNYELLTTIKGVGPKTALASLIKTRNFTRFTSTRKFACYCGTAPFEHSSGTSIRKRTRVSHLADKEMKTLLDLGASSAIQFDPELKAYYQRRVLEGKSKKSTINIVRNKIIYRMFAVIKRQSPFVTDYKRPNPKKVLVNKES